MSFEEQYSTSAIYSRRQDNRIESAEGLFSERSVIPTSSESLVFDADREALFLFEEVECKAPHRSHVLGGMTGADPALVLPEGYV